MSETVVALSGGNVAKLRAVGDVSERLRRPIAACMARISPEGQEVLSALSERDKNPAVHVPTFSAEDMAVLNEMNDHAIVALVESWSFPEPVTLEAVTSRKARDYDALRSACAPAVGSMFVDFGASAEPESPIAPSNGLSMSSVEGAPILASDFPSSSAPTA